jgi:alpha-tubulin suppressor-like RCC1 family protein
MKKLSIQAFFLSAIMSFSCQEEPQQTVIDNNNLKIAASSIGSLVLKKDGSLWVLKDHFQQGASKPVKVGDDFSEIATKYVHSMALKKDGSLWTWGSNAHGQLGDGTFENRSIPTRIGQNFVAIAAGGHHSVGLKHDGSLWTWGWNQVGQLGNGTNEMANSPQKIGEGFKSIAAGDMVTFAIKEDGSLWGCGLNTYGELGNGTTVNENTLIMILDKDIKQFDPGWHHPAVVKIDGTLWTWGVDLSMTTKDYIIGDPILKPRLIAVGIDEISSGRFFSFIKESSNKFLAWGYNDHGQLGTGDKEIRPMPDAVNFRFEKISCGGGHTIALKADGSVWVWGDNSRGQFGDGTTIGSNSPKNIQVQ